MCDRVASGVDLHNIIGDGGADNNGSGGLRWSLRQGWGRRPSTTMAMRWGATTQLQARRLICRHDSGHVRHLLTAQRRSSFGARATTIARGGSRRQ